MTEERRKKLLLIALGVALAVLLITRLAPMLGSSGDPGGPGFGPGAGIGVAEVAALRVDLLEAEARTYSPGRDPFRYFTPPSPPRKPPPPPPPVEVTPPPEPPPDPGPQPPPIEFVYLGSFGQEERPIAVLVDGDDIHNAYEGDVIDGQFVVGHIGFESVDLEYVDFPELPPARLAVGG